MDKFILEFKPMGGEVPVQAIELVLYQEDILEIMALAQHKNITLVPVCKFIGVAQFIELETNQVNPTPTVFKSTSIDLDTLQVQWRMVINGNLFVSQTIRLDKLIEGAMDDKQPNTTDDTVCESQEDNETEIPQG